MAFPKEIWLKIKTAYESGLYSSVVDLYSEVSKTYENTDIEFPTLFTIQHKATAENWKKTALKPVIEATMQDMKASEIARSQFDPLMKVVKWAKAQIENETEDAPAAAQKLVDIFGLKANDKLDIDSKNEHSLKVNVSFVDVEPKKE